MTILYMALELSLKIVLIIEYNSLVGDWHEDLFSVLVCQVVHTVVYVVV